MHSGGHVAPLEVQTFAEPTKCYRHRISALRQQVCGVLHKVGRLGRIKPFPALFRKHGRANGRNDSRNLTLRFKTDCMFSIRGSARMDRAERRRAPSSMRPRTQPTTFPSARSFAAASWIVPPNGTWEVYCFHWWPPWLGTKIKSVCVYLFQDSRRTVVAEHGYTESAAHISSNG